ncbi:uncharacterized protein LOC130645263 [Hydractinia symbiolongicarpus]|uniref:uncharacterized protein LOC130645263 n=1 Tax=Hydractinia symbiolongicarpus TaxID=13093 RepID=UPI00254E4FAC|nr:uncharacterized protein LOC130645263 [Hydractinia symbiolongicarpus]
MASNNIGSVINFYQKKVNLENENITYSTKVEQNNVNESVKARSNNLVNEGRKLLEAARQEYDEAVVFKYDVKVFINEMERYTALWNTSARSHHDQDSYPKNLISQLNSSKVSEKSSGKPEKVHCETFKNDEIWGSIPHFVKMQIFGTTTVYSRKFNKQGNM